MAKSQRKCCHLAKPPQPQQYSGFCFVPERVDADGRVSGNVSPCVMIPFCKSSVTCSRPVTCGVSLVIFFFFPLRVTWPLQPRFHELRVMLSVKAQAQTTIHLPNLARSIRSRTTGYFRNDKHGEGEKKRAHHGRGPETCRNRNRPQKRTSKMLQASSLFVSHVRKTPTGHRLCFDSSYLTLHTQAKRWVCCSSRRAAMINNGMNHPPKHGDFHPIADPVRQVVLPAFGPCSSRPSLLIATTIISHYRPRYNEHHIHTFLVRYNKHSLHNKSILGSL